MCRYLSSHDSTLKLYFPIGTNSSIFSETPGSRNVSVGSTVEFSCATPYDTTSLSWSISGSGIITTNFDVPGGGKGSTVNFIATVIRNNTKIVCSLGGTINGSGVFNHTPVALLLVQGTREEHNMI